MDQVSRFLLLTILSAGHVLSYNYYLTAGKKFNGSCFMYSCISFFYIIPYKLNAKQTKNIECMCLSYNVFLDCNIALVYELICWNQCLMEKL